MEDSYKNTRAEIASSLYGVNIAASHRLNKLWWALSDVSKQLSDVIVEVRGQLDTVERMINEAQAPELPLEDPGQEHDH